MRILDYLNILMAIVEAKGIKRSFRSGDEELTVLSGIDLRINPGDFVAVTGESGTGKSTLLHIIGLLDRPTEGELLLDGRGCLSLSDEKTAQLRNRFIGFVFQFHHLLPEFTSLENVMLPCLVAGKTFEDAKSRAIFLLDKFEIESRAYHFPNQLSGGEQQRVALARALANSPQFLIADEPTGNLDERHSHEIEELLCRMNKEENLTILLATHDIKLAERAKRVYLLTGGMLSAIKSEGKVE